MNALRPHGVLVDVALLAAGVLWASARRWSRRRGDGAAALGIAAGMAILLAGPVTLLEFANARRTQTPDVFAARVRDALPPGAELRFAPNIRDEGVLFYLARRIPATSESQVARVVEAAPATGLYLIAHRADELPASERVRVTTVTRGVGSNGHLVLVRAVPVGDEPPRTGGP